VAERFDLDLLDDTDPFEIDDQAAHLFKHVPLGIDEIYEVWESDPLFYPAIPPAHWLMVAEVAGHVLVVPLAPPDSGDRRSVDRSAATRQQCISLINTGENDDNSQEDDPQAGVRPLREGPEPDTEGPRAPT